MHLIFFSLLCSREKHQMTNIFKSFAYLIGKLKNLRLISHMMQNTEHAALL